MSVVRRREAILTLVAKRRLATQEDLVAALSEVGIEASQASVSRDIAALGLVKIGGRWAPPSSEGTSQNPLTQRIADSTLAIAAAGDNLLVVRTPAGEAQGVALALDRLEIGGVVGTVAGDDTIFVATADAAATRRVRQRLEALVRG